MTFGRVALPLVLLITVACQPATGGLGTATFTDSGTDTATDDTGSAEGNSAEGSTNPTAGDGDGTPGDGDGTPGDGDGMPGDGDGAPGDGDGENPCGNGAIDPGEECDGSDLGGQDCVSLNFASGTLACGSDCKFETSGCMVSQCGNGMIDMGEECEPGDFGGATCMSLGFGPGALLCTVSCTIDSSMCGVPGEGEACGFLDPCGANLYCEWFVCYDGSHGDPCSADSQCISNSCSGFQCD